MAAQIDEQRVRELGNRLTVLAREGLPNPVDAPTTSGALLGFLLGRRGAMLYDGVASCLRDGNSVSATVLIRAMAELVVRTTWIALDPERHGRRWFLQSDEADLRTLRAIERNLGPYQGGAFRPDDLQRMREVRQAALDAEKAELSPTGPTVPSVEGMVNEAARVFPGQTYRLRQAYDVAFRGASPWVHTEASSFKNDLGDEDAEPRFLGEHGVVVPASLWLLAAAFLAHIVMVAGAMAGLEGVAAEAAEIGNELGGPAPERNG